MRLPRRNNGAAFAAMLTLGACNGSTAPARPPTQLVKSGGDSQGWYFHNPFPTPLSVTAEDASGLPVSGVVVTWAVASGDGAVTPTQSTTDASGVASTIDSVGSSSLQRVSATFTGLPGPVSFTAFATTAPGSAADTLVGLAFRPNSVVVRTGGTVTWTWNDGATQHNLNFAPNDPTPHPAGSPTQASGTESFTPTTVGVYHFFCSIHAGMNGTLTVVH